MIFIGIPCTYLIKENYSFLIKILRTKSNKQTNLEKVFVNVATGTRGFLTSKSTACRFFLRNHLHWSISETPGPSFYRRPQAFHWRQKICRVLDRAGLWSYPVKKGVSNEKVGVSDEKFGSPIKRLGSSMKSFGLRFGGLR